MSGPFKSLISKLTNRRKSHLWRRRRKNSSVVEGQAEESIHTLAKQMSGLRMNSPEPSVGVVGSESSLPHIFGNENFTHDFEIAGLNFKWPGPLYDENAQFAPGIFDKPRHPKRRPRRHASKRRLSHDERPSLQKRDERGVSQSLKAVSRTTKLSKQPQYFGTPPRREPPTHLLNLPGEIRNHIFKYVLGFENDESIVAQFRLIITPKRGRGDKAHTIRRLPREPSVALVCRKLQLEVLSLFYGETKFMFNRTECPSFASKGTTNNRAMTNEASILAWMPKFGFADYVRRIEMHFRAREPTFKTFCIIYTITKECDNELHISNNLSEDSEYCTCFEDELLRRLRHAQESSDLRSLKARNVPELASRLSHHRSLALKVDASMSAEHPYKIYRPTKAVCDYCERECLREIGSGV